MEKQKLVEELQEAYTRGVLIDFYRNYWRDLALGNNRLRASIPPGKRIPKKADLALLFAEFLTDRKLLEAFLDKLPEDISFAIHHAVWEYPVLVREFEEIEERPVFQPGLSRYWRSEEQLLPDFQLFKVWNPYPYQFDCQEHDHLALPDALRIHLKDYLPKPANYDIREAEGPANDALRHREDNILQIMEMARFFIEGDHLKYAARGDKILVSSLKKFTAQAGIKEFYKADDRSLQWMKTQLILWFFGDLLDKKAPQEALPLLQHLVSSGIEKKQLSFAKLLLTHLKGGGYLRDLPNWENRGIPSATVCWIMKQMPRQSWVSTQNILEALHYRDMDHDFLGYIRGMRDLYIRQDNPYYRNKLHVAPENFHFLMFQPLLKGIMFMLSALGLLEIAYLEPENLTISQDGKPYLSIYDGLTHIKLTSLGAFVFGRSERYEGPIETVSTGEVVVDDKGLILTLRGADPLKAMVLEQLSHPIGGNRFKVDFGSFLRECRSKKDVKNQIARFRKEVCKKPPPIWESFFDTALQRVGPLTRRPRWEVYQVDPSPELIDLLATDPVLKSHVLKAEDYHLLIRPSDRKKVIRRLEECGFLITDL